MGFDGLSPTDLEPFIPKGTIEIGWRLLPEYRYRELATEAALAILSCGFGTLNLDEIISIAV